MSAHSDDAPTGTETMPAYKVEFNILSITLYFPIISLDLNCSRLPRGGDGGDGGGGGGGGASTGAGRVKYTRHLQKLTNKGLRIPITVDKADEGWFACRE